MRTRHVIYAGPALVGRSTSLELLVPRRRGQPMWFERIRGSACESPERFDTWHRRLAGGVDMTLASGAAHICIALLYTGSNWFPSFQVARMTGYPHIRELIERAISFLPVLDGVVFVADSQPERHDANLEELESVIVLLRSEGIDPARVPFVFQLNKRDLPNVLGVDELRCTLATPRCAYVESVAVRGHGVHRALEMVLDLSDGRVPAPVQDDTP